MQDVSALLLINISLDGATPELHDVVRLEDRYGRAGTSEA